VEAVTRDLREGNNRAATPGVGRWGEIARGGEGWLWLRRLAVWASKQLEYLVLASVSMRGACPVKRQGSLMDFGSQRGR
jgi:hypothetical protein